MKRCHSNNAFNLLIVAFVSVSCCTGYIIAGTVFCRMESGLTISNVNCERSGTGP